MVGYILPNEIKSRIEQVFITQTFSETKNWEILSPELSTRLITCLKSVYRKTSKE